MLHNNGAQLQVVNLWPRVDRVVLEPPPNEGDFEGRLPQMITGLGGRTAPIAAGGGVGPQLAENLPVVNTAAPPDRQKDYHNDGGGLTATPSFSIRKQELERSVYARL